MLADSSWKRVQDFYKNAFDLGNYIVDLMADYNIVLLCVSGSSNDSISKALDLDIDDIRNTIKNRLSFDGWETNLKFSPYYTYINMSFDDFIEVCKQFFDINFAHKVYYMCEKCKLMGDQLDESWS